MAGSKPWVQAQGMPQPDGTRACVGTVIIVGFGCCIKNVCLPVLNSSYDSNDTCIAWQIIWSSSMSDRGLCRRFAARQRQKGIRLWDRINKRSGCWIQRLAAKLLDP